MATEVTIDSNGRMVEKDEMERWRPASDGPYILTLEDSRNLRGSVLGSKRERVERWKKLQPLFTPEVWQQVLGHLEGMEG